MKKIKYFLLVFVVGAVIFGCATGPRITKVTQFVPTGEFGNRQEKNSVIVEATPLDDAKINSFPELTPTINYIGTDWKGAPAQKTGKVYLLGDNVQFKVTVTNRAGHVLRFTGTVLKLIDDFGIMYDAIGRQEFSAVHGNNWTQLAPHFRKIKYLDPNVEVLPDMTWTGYIAFNMKLKEVAETFKFAVYDLTTKTDAAGNPTQKTRFEFNFKKEIIEKTSK